MGHERNKPICIICPAGINSPLKVATNEVIHWMNVGVEEERDRDREGEKEGWEEEGEKVKRQRERERRRRSLLARGVRANPNSI